MSLPDLKKGLFIYDCPPGLLALSILFWSWQINLLPLGIAMSFILEIPRWLPVRIKISDSQFVYISNSCALILLLSMIAFFTTNLQRHIFLVVEWIPLITFLLIAAQLYSESRLVPLPAIMASIRGRKVAKQFPESIDLRLPYFFMTMISASMVAPRGLSFYLQASILVLWALWSVRKKRSKATVWVMMGSMSIGLGFLIQLGLSQMQEVIGDVVIEQFLDWSDKDVSRTSTAIGQIGQLKMSNKIVLRIKSSERKSLLLKQASYNRYYGGSWHISDSRFELTLHDTTNKHWKLRQQNTDDKHWLEILAYLDNREGVLALPSGSNLIVNQGIDSKPHLELQKNRYGSVKIANAAALLDLKVYFDPGNPDVSEPMPHDLELPKRYQQVMHEVVQQLGLDKLPQKQAAQKLKSYFSQNFRYSLIQNEADVKFRPLDQFLRKSRRGHCEYFATTGALILRAAGIPSRYITGYLMDEYQTGIDRYIIRNRHAHAWIQAFIDGAWVNLDYTPATWAAMEEAAAPWWEVVYDSVSHTAFIVQDWWWAKPRSAIDYVLAGLAILLLVFFLRRIGGIKKLLQYKKYFVLTTKLNSPAPEKDSPFYKIIQHFEQLTAPKPGGQTIKQWLTSITKDHSLEEKLDLRSPTSTPSISLQQLIHWHYQYRFGNSVVPLLEFEKAVDSWLNYYKQA